MADKRLRGGFNVIEYAEVARYGVVVLEVNMFEVGELVVHGSAGVCYVKEIGTPEVFKDNSPRQYYTLVSANDATKVIYMPVDSQKVYLRRAMSREEAQTFMGELAEIPAKTGWNSRTMIDEFRADISTTHARGCASWIRGIYELQERKLKSGKKQLTGTEKNCLKLAESYLYDEMSKALDLPQAEIKKVVLQSMGIA